MPCFNTVPYKRLQRVLCRSYKLYHQRRKTAHRALQERFRRLCPFNRSLYQTDASGYNTACSTLERITAPQHLQHIPDTTVTPGRCTAQRRPPIIIRYIRVRGCPCYGSMPAGAAYYRPCQPGGGLDASHARRLEVWHWVSGQGGHSSTIHPAGQSSSRGVAGGAEPLAALAAALFGLSPDSQ